VAVRNIARGGGKAFKTEVKGLKELERKLKALRMDNPQITDELYEVVAGASDELRNQMKSAARAAGWGSRKTTVNGHAISGEDAINSIFSAVLKQGGTSRRRISAIAGVGKRKTMIEWRAGKRPHPLHPPAKRAPGEKVAEAFATMLEIGTSKNPALPAIIAALKGSKGMIIDKVGSGYKALIDKYSK